MHPEKRVSLAVDGLRVMLAMPVHRDVPVRTMMSVLASWDACHARGIPLDIQVQEGSSLVHHARTKIAHLFLQSECNRLFWIDSDMAWEPEAFIRLVALSSVMECVSGAYPAKRDPIEFRIDAPIGEDVVANEYGCLPLKGVGLGFTIVSRRVMEELAARAPLRRYPDISEPIPRIFRCDDDGDRERGEDMAFFADVRALGVPAHVDPTITLSHIGSKAYTARFADHLTPA